MGHRGGKASGKKLTKNKKKRDKNNKKHQQTEEGAPYRSTGKPDKPKRSGRQLDAN